MFLSVNALETIFLTVFILALQTTVPSCLLNFGAYRFANTPVTTLSHRAC